MNSTHEIKVKKEEKTTGKANIRNQNMSTAKKNGKRGRKE
jgi:hypothetical protein